MLRRADTWHDLVRDFRWDIPERCNIGIEACDRWADGSGRTALIHHRADGEPDLWSFDHLKALSNRLANVLQAYGIGRGDRIAVLLPQRPETAAAHIGVYKLGAIAVPLFVLFGEEALEYRLANSGARAIVTDSAGVVKLAELRQHLPELGLVLSVDGDGPGAVDLPAAVARASDAFTPCPTSADDPALLIYTSGTTGQPKGALHAHRVLRGHLPGVELPHEFFPQPGDLFWTPADWAWIGGLINVLLSSLFHGVPVLAHRFRKFDPEEAFALMAAYDVRNTFLPPTACKMLRQVPQPEERWSHRLRSVASGGETLGAELIEWGRSAFGVTINEFYGQTECNLIVSNCAGLMPVIPGSMGKAVPGHRVAVIDSTGREVPAGVLGDIAVRRPDPVMFLGYWDQAEATEAKFRGPWLVTGDQGRMDEDGRFHFVGRDDDVITSGGYRIGPGEVEDCLIRHEAIALAAVVGVPDALRTERVKAFVVLKPGFTASDALAEEIQAFVRTRLASHEYPREVAFVDSLPMTTTGKIIRRALRGQ